MGSCIPPGKLKSVSMEYTSNLKLVKITRKYESGDIYTTSGNEACEMVQKLGM